jgi:hypothetical protein
MADISIDQLNAINSLVAQQQQEDSAQQQRQKEIEQLSGLVSQEIQKTSQDAEVEKLLNRYKQIGGEYKRVKGIAESGSKGIQTFNPFTGFTPTDVLSSKEKLQYLQETDRLEKEKSSIAEKLRAYLPKEPEKALPAAQLQAPEQSTVAPQPAPAAPATPQPAQPSQQPAQEQPQQRSSQFDAFERINAERSQFLDFAFQELTKLPPRMQ